MKKLFSIFISLLIFFVFVGCDFTEDNDKNNDKDNTQVNELDDSEKFMRSIQIPEVKEAKNLNEFITGVDYKDGSHNNEGYDEGVVISPYYTLKANGQNVECYSVRTSIGIHTFATIITDKESLPVRVEIDSDNEKRSVEVLPKTRNVSAILDGYKTKATLTSINDFTFVFDKSIYMPITIFVKEESKFEAKEGYELVEIEPGDHEEELSPKSEKTILYFKKGVHNIRHKIWLQSNCDVYFEEGTLVNATQPTIENEEPLLNPTWAGQIRWHALLTGQNLNNIKIYGFGFLNYSRLSWHGRLGICFSLVDGIEISNVSLINCPEWTLEIERSQNINIDNVSIWGYRQNSDGICIVDSRNAEITNCFGRTGDDIFEIKSQYGDDAVEYKFENIRFKNCTGWPDKARGMGIIHETVRDIANVVYEDCSIGFASAHWMDQLGAIVIILGYGNANISNVHFKNIEIYHGDHYPINITVYEEHRGSVSDIYFENIKILDNENNAIRLRDDTKKGKIENIYFDGIYRNGVYCKTYSRLNLSCVNVDKSIGKLNERSGR